VVDVVIPAHPKDFPLLRHCVRGVLRNIVPLRQVIIVSSDRYTARDHRVKWVPEPESGQGGLPSLREIESDWASRSFEATPRAAWIYQQLLKLGAGTYIESLSNRYLVVDADVIFLRRVSFAEEEGRFPYSRAKEYNPPYHDAYRRLTGEEPASRESFVAHHMLFEGELLSEFFSSIEEVSGEPWYWAYVHAADPSQYSAISEYETYGLWMLSHHREMMRYRQLAWRDASIAPTALGRAHLGLDYDFVAVHAYMRAPRRRRVRDLGLRLAREIVPARRVRG
jgi:Family of unknown function (DUF6492)